MREAQSRLEAAKKRFSEALSRPAPDQGGPLLVTLAPAMPVPGVTSVQLDELLDDAAWAPWADRVARGEFSAAILELPLGTFAAEGLRSKERPSGVKGLPREHREPVRIETVLHRRLSTLRPRNTEWAADPAADWPGRHPQGKGHGVIPTTGFL